MTIEYAYLPHELRPPTLVRQIGVHHNIEIIDGSSSSSNSHITYILDVDDEEYASSDEEYASSDEYDENENEEMFENIYINKTQFYTEEIPTPYCADVDANCDDDEDEDEYAYEENDDDEYCL